MAISSFTRILSLLAVLTLCGTVGCFGNSRDENNTETTDSTGSTEATDSTTETLTNSPALPSICGTIVEDVLLNPVPAGNADPVTVTSTGLPDTLIVSPIATETSRLSGTILVKLHGVSDDGVHPSLISSADSLIESSTANGAFYVSAGENCGVTTEGGGSGNLGAIFTSSGESLAELLLEQGGLIASPDVCSASLLSSCYEAIVPEERISRYTISWFLWKPVSERDGNVTVLVDPFNIRVVVTGAITETLVDFGPSNGRGTTARGNRPGCSYGQATVEFFDSDGQRVLVNDGQRSISVSGCDRLELRA